MGIGTELTTIKPALNTIKAIYKMNSIAVTGLVFLPQGVSYGNVRR